MKPTFTLLGFSLLAVALAATTLDSEEVAVEPETGTTSDVSKWTKFFSFSKPVQTNELAIDKSLTMFTLPLLIYSTFQFLDGLRKMGASEQAIDDLIVSEFWCSGKSRRDEDRKRI